MTSRSRFCLSYSGNEDLRVCLPSPAFAPPTFQCCQHVKSNQVRSRHPLLFGDVATDLKTFNKPNSTGRGGGYSKLFLIFAMILLSPIKSELHVEQNTHHSSQ